MSRRKPHSVRDKPHADALIADIEAALAPLVTRNNAARCLCISLRKIDRLISEGSLPTVRVGRSVRIPRNAIVNLVLVGLSE